MDDEQSRNGRRRTNLSTEDSVKCVKRFESTQEMGANVDLVAELERSAGVRRIGLNGQDQGTNGVPV